jgi:hypothetical protein
MRHVLPLFALVLACGASQDPVVDDVEDVDAASGGSANTGGKANTGGSVGTGGKANTGGSVGTGGKANTGGSTNSGGSASTGGSVGTGGAPPPSDGGPPGTWVDVTPAGVNLTNFGLGYVVLDPARANDVYVGGTQGLFKSTDYGVTFTKINTKAGIYTLAIANASAATPPTLWGGSGRNDGSALKSTDGGVTWNVVGGGSAADLYSIQVDPYDSQHLISGLHEIPGIVQSTDGGSTWTAAQTDPSMSGGKSWYPFFIDTGMAATTRGRWIVLPQPTGGTVGTWFTSNGGAQWSHVETNEHPHGNSQIYQTGGIVFMAGIYGSGGGMGGVYRSTDLGQTFTQVGGNHEEAIVWGTPTRLYAMYGWAAGTLGDVGTNYETAPQPGTSGWANATVPSGMRQGPCSEVTTYDGSHYVFVASMWNAGLWRYVE